MEMLSYVWLHANFCVINYNLDWRVLFYFEATVYFWSRHTTEEYEVQK